MRNILVVVLAIITLPSMAITTFQYSYDTTFKTKGFYAEIIKDSSGVSQVYWAVPIKYGLGALTFSERMDYYSKKNVSESIINYCILTITLKI